MRDVRFGSYSMCATLAGTPSLSTRLKSISRYCRLWPPPWCRAVMRPWTLRPPFFDSGTTRDFSGVDRVTSTKSATLAPRRPGVVGLYLRIPIVSQSSEDSDYLDVPDRRQAVGPPKMSIRSPSARVTIARLLSARLPKPLLVRLRLPWRLIVLTPVTLTEKTA